VGGDRTPRAAIEFVLDDLGGDLSTVRAAASPGADLVWASASVHHAGDQQRAVDTLAGLLAPGGRLAWPRAGCAAVPAVGWASASPGWRSGSTRPRTAGSPAWDQPGRGADAARLANAPPGRTDRGADSHLAVRDADAAHPTRPAAGGRRARAAGRAAPGTGLLADDDVAAWARLLDEGDPAWLGHREDLQRLTARSVHVGQQSD
jgi:hypothetical protein